MRRARSSFPHAAHGPSTCPLTRNAGTFFRGVSSGMPASLVLDRLAALLPIDVLVAAEVALGAHVVEDRVVPVRVLDEVHLLRPALVARLPLCAEAVAAEHRVERCGRGLKGSGPRRVLRRPHRNAFVSDALG